MLHFGSSTRAVSTTLKILLGGLWPRCMVESEWAFDLLVVWILIASVYTISKAIGELATGRRASQQVVSRTIELPSGFLITVHDWDFAKFTGCHQDQLDGADNDRTTVLGALLHSIGATAATTISALGVIREADYSAAIQAWTIQVPGATESDPSTQRAPTLIELGKAQYLARIARLKLGLEAVTSTASPPIVHPATAPGTSSVTARESQDESHLVPARRDGSRHSGWEWANSNVRPIRSAVWKGSETTSQSGAQHWAVVWIEVITRQQSMPLCRLCNLPAICG